MTANLIVGGALVSPHLYTAACSRQETCQVVRGRSRAPTTTAIERFTPSRATRTCTYRFYGTLRVLDEPLTHRKQTCQRQACEPGPLTLPHTDTDRLATAASAVVLKGSFSSPTPRREPPAYERQARGALDGEGETWKKGIAFPCRWIDLPCFFSSCMAAGRGRCWRAAQRGSCTGE